MIRAINATELCGLCHVGSHHPTYTVWIGGPHDLAGVECIDCHGYDLTPGLNAFLNHTFSVDPDVACGQSDDCHNGTVEWALNQLEEIQTSFEHLVEELETEAAALGVIVGAYNLTADANHTLANYVLDAIDEAVEVAHYYGYDGSEGFHDPPETFDAVNEAFRDLLNAKAYFYENMPALATGGGISTDTLIIVGGAAGGIVVGLLLGVLVGRRR
jgi:formate-dependent nitrite reductase cytochrome c552 subunit